MKYEKAWTETVIFDGTFVIQTSNSDSNSHSHSYSDEKKRGTWHTDIF